MFDQHRTFILDAAVNRRLFLDAQNIMRSDFRTRASVGFAVPIRVTVGKQDVYGTTAALNAGIKGNHHASYRANIRDAAYIVRVWPK